DALGQRKRLRPYAPAACRPESQHRARRAVRTGLVPRHREIADDRRDLGRVGAIGAAGQAVFRPGWLTAFVEQPGIDFRMPVACVVPGHGEAVPGGSEARFEGTMAALGDLVGAVNETEERDRNQPEYAH